MRIKKIVSLLSYYIIPLLVLGLSVFNPSRKLFLNFGEISQVLIILIMFIKPISTIFNLKIVKQNMFYRRQIGVLSFWFFFFHAGGLYILMNFEPSYFFGFGHLLFAGLAGILMLVLTITSNEFSFYYFKRNWKRIQYLAYPTLFLVLLHTSMVKGEMIKFYVIGTLFLVLKFFEFRKSRK